MCKWHPTYGMIFATLLATVNWSQYAKADPRVFTAKDFNFYDPRFVNGRRSLSRA